MNRLIICIILLGFGPLAAAETLYRWIEPDGSITFSPTKPPAGVEYKEVNAAGADQSGAILAASTPSQPSILATSEHGLEQALPPVNDTKILSRPVPAVAARQGLTYAPDTSSRPAKKIEPAVQATAPAAQTNIGATVASASKKRQCLDLSKRVLSLERRLRSKLAPEDMDNTVVAMARYQRSYDQHCVE